MEAACFSCYCGPLKCVVEAFQPLHTVSMSQASGLGDLESGQYHHEEPRTAANPTPRDGAGPLFSMYSKMGEKEADKVAKIWQKDADGILIFTGLFSTAVATFLTVSIQDLKPNPHLTSEFYLEKIYTRLDDTDSSRASLDISTKPPVFSPPSYVVWVNSLWFLSFAISLSYAMLAIMLQQWARRYQTATQHLRSSPHQRARVRAFFSDGLHVLWVIEGVRAMIHLSIFLFLAGLLIYLFNISHASFAAVVWWVAISTLVYVSFTLLPIVRPNSPYYAPLSSILLSLYAFISYAVFNFLSSPVFSRFGSNAMERSRKLRDHYRNLFFEDLRKIAEDAASQQSSVIDVHVLESMFDSLGEDGAQEALFEAIPGFFDSELVHVLKEDLSDEFRGKCSRALTAFLDHTFSYNSIPESVKSSRLVICLNAAHAAIGSEEVSQILWHIISKRWPELLKSVETGHAIRSWGNSIDEQFNPDVRRIVAQIVVGVRERDDRWISLVKAEYGIAERVLRDYVGHGDSVLLCILLHLTRETFRTGSWMRWILTSLSEFNIRDTFPELQHAFCALWNDIVLGARHEEGPINNPVRILRDIRHAYFALHQGTDAALTEFSASPYHFHPILRQPQSYRLCNVAGHRQRLIIYTPIIGSLNFPSLTQLNRTLAVFRPQSDHTTEGSTASNQAEEPNVAPSSMDGTPDPSHTQGFTSPPAASNSVHITQAASTAGPSVPESIETLIDLFRDEASHDPRQSAASPVGVSLTNFVLSSDPMPQLDPSESGETPQVPLARFQNPDPVLATITPSPGPPGDDPATLRDAISIALLSRPLEGNKQQEIISSLAAPDVSEIPSTAKSIPRSIPTTVVSDSPSSPILHPTLSSGMTTAEPPSFLESNSIQPNHIPHTFRSPSSSLTTASSHISPQVASPFDVQVTPSIGTPSSHDETQDFNPSLPVTLLVHLAKTAPPAHDIVAPTLQPEDQVQHDRDKF